uniref:butyrophilin subfamily 2 member A2-like isoform X2 n=1 Tax=Scatophagus argus TaxID=75038 RepID=UPI001ED7CD2F|nr:butyrophilin subfamily 2 member A2-like isoform X2 [Scatophagus argus]
MFLLLFLLFVLSEAASASSVETDDVLQVRPGGEVTLPCNTTEASIRAVQWTRDDLEPSEYVLLYRDGGLDAKRQHSSYQGRVELLYSQLKTGNVSLILKNVSSSDNGTYKCRVAAGGSRRKRALIDTEPIRLISLEVTGSDSQKADNMHGDQTSDSPEGIHARGHAGLAAGVLVPLAVGVVGVVMFLRTRRRHEAVTDHLYT